MTGVQLPKSPMERSNLTKLISFDKDKGAGYTFFHVAASKTRGDRIILWCFPIDVREDGKPHIPQFGLVSRAVRDKETPITITTKKELLRPAGKGSWSENWTIAVLFPETPDRLFEGVRSIFGESIVGVVQETAKYSSVVGHMRETIHEKEEQLRESDRYAVLDDAKEVVRFMREGEPERRRGQDESKKEGKE